MKISGYITSKDPLLMNYPAEEAITSLKDVVDELIVCDTSLTNDGSKELLDRLKATFEIEGKTFKVITADFVDWNAKNSGIYDGSCKAHARSLCTGDFLIQLDLDEIFVGNRQQIEDIIKKASLDKENPVLAIPVVEPWGSAGKIRVDINPWKERISLNDPTITHGIPASHRKYVDGMLYAHQGVDGCNLINKNSGNPVPILNFVKPEIEQLRREAVINSTSTMEYEKWFNKITDKMPYVYHLSWWSVYQKMLKYKLFWNNSWLSLYNDQKPTGYNPFFNKPFEQISDQEMIETARKIEDECGGHIFHSPYISGVSAKTNSIVLYKNKPDIIEKWCLKNKTP